MSGIARGRGYWHCTEGASVVGLDLEMYADDYRLNVAGPPSEHSPQRRDGTQVVP